jgi:hypothetical protein
VITDNGTGVISYLLMVMMVSEMVTIGDGNDTIITMRRIISGRLQQASTVMTIVTLSASGLEVLTLERLVLFIIIIYFSPLRVCK